jgi:hypothetical protein
MINLREYKNTFPDHPIGSQNGEDGIIEKIFSVLNITKGTFVDCGAGDGKELSNTYHICTLGGWSGLLIEADLAKSMKSMENLKLFTNVKIINKKISLEKRCTIEEIINVFSFIPPDFDFLTIDIDGYDYWVWAEMKYRPKVVCIEFNANSYIKGKARVISYDPNYVYESTDYHGATPLALERLGNFKGYDLVCWTGSNLIFIKKELNNGLFKIITSDEVELFGSKKDAKFHKNTPINFIFNPAFSWEEQRRINNDSDV